MNKINLAYWKPSRTISSDEEDNRLFIYSPEFDFSVEDVREISEPQEMMRDFFSTEEYSTSRRELKQGSFQSENSLYDIAEFLELEAGKHEDPTHRCLSNNAFHKSYFDLAIVNFIDSSFTERASKILTNEMFFMIPTKEFSNHTGFHYKRKETGNWDTYYGSGIGGHSPTYDLEGNLYVPQQEPVEVS